MFKIVKWIVILVIVFFIFGHYNKASALSCAYQTEEQHINSSNTIFVGKVISVNTSQATFQVSKYWKGDLNSSITVNNTTYWTGYPGGNIFFELGKEYIVYANKENGIYTAKIDCSRTSIYNNKLETTISKYLGNAKIPVNIIANSNIPTYCKYVNDINSNLWWGNRNNDRNQVIALQKFIQNYYGVRINTSGNYGLLTRYYVKKFQREMGVNPTGGVGPITISKLKNLCNQVVIDSNGGPNCKVYYDGCNTCSRSYPDEPMICSLMACIQGFPDGQMPRPYCKEYFTNSLATPVINSFSGPTTLKVGELGTWNVSAKISTNEQLTYNITWGDESYMVSNYLNSSLAKEIVYNQNTSFQHSYNNPGTYTVTIQVKSQNGQTAKTTATVVVTGNTISEAPNNCKVWYDGCNTCSRSIVGGALACTRMYCIQKAGAICREYFSNLNCYDNAVAYSEGQSKSCLTVDGMQQCIADASFVCRSGIWKIEGIMWR